MPRSATDASKQKSLSKFFSPKASIPVEIQNEWDGSNMQSTKMELNREQRSANVDNAGTVTKKRVLPQSIGGSTSGGVAYRPPTAGYQTSSASGTSKRIPSIGGVSFKDTAGLTTHVLGAFCCFMLAFGGFAVLIADHLPHK